MDDRLARIEAGLERLVPRGLSDTTKDALETRIDEWAGTVADDRRRGWKVGAAAAAVALLGAGAFLQQGAGPGSAPVAMPGVDAPAEAPAAIETLSMAVQVNSRFDGGWVHGDGSQKPFRYHGYEVTNETEMVDPATGYEVRVVERREEWIPVTMTSL
ncbi:MAG: hypothetical protein HKN82_09645 [Akkermansiaceae bacterium]|nr:hypothetical protein [Akkermansiaceae bacterium]NNM29044.1 hypothetical protein [Akkermansiaceae bacterium]